MKRKRDSHISIIITFSALGQNNIDNKNFVERYLATELEANQNLIRGCF